MILPFLVFPAVAFQHTSADCLACLDGGGGNQQSTCLWCLWFISHLFFLKKDLTLKETKTLNRQCVLKNNVTPSRQKERWGWSFLFHYPSPPPQCLKSSARHVQSDTVQNETETISSLLVFQLWKVEKNISALTLKMLIEQCVLDTNAAKQMSCAAT